MDTMTQANVRTRIEALLADWHSIGQVARHLGISRVSAERGINRLRMIGKLETRRETFWRNGANRVGLSYRIAAVECGPVAMDQRRGDFLAALFECEHGVEMCEACTAKGRKCAHRCITCNWASGVFFEGAR